jgi:hypothetical protein
MLTPDQIICIPSKRKADGSIDIIMSNREGKVFCCTEADDRLAWDDNFRMNTGYGRYDATYNMVGLNCFNDKLPCV